MSTWMTVKVHLNIPGLLVEQRQASSGLLFTHVKVLRWQFDVNRVMP